MEGTESSLVFGAIVVPGSQLAQIPGDAVFVDRKTAGGRPGGVVPTSATILCGTLAQGVQELVEGLDDIGVGASQGGQKEGKGVQGVGGSGNRDRGRSAVVAAAAGGAKDFGDVCKAIFSVLRRHKVGGQRRFRGDRNRRAIIGDPPSMRWADFPGAVGVDDPGLVLGDDQEVDGRGEQDGG